MIIRDGHDPCKPELGSNRLSDSDAGKLSKGTRDIVEGVPSAFSFKAPAGCPTRGGFTGGPRCRWDSGNFANAKLGFPGLIDQNWAAFFVGVMAEAAPQPLLGLRN
jgi:hypothetical protein